MKIYDPPPFGAGINLIAGSTGVTGTASGILWNSAGVLAVGAATLAGGTALAGLTTLGLSSSITSTIGTITANTPALTATQTWNAVGTTFDGIFLNVTNTASAAASHLMDLQVAAVSKFRVDVNGAAVFASNVTGGNFTATAGNFFIGGSGYRLTDDGTTGHIILTNFATTTGVGFDVATDSILKVRTRAQNADAAITALSATLSQDRGIVLTNQTSSAAAQLGTLTNAPTAGNPGFWAKILIGGVSYSVPCWAG